ncbi:S-layer homology domain-containing protein [Oscillibacter hominis]|uniref:S-layer homology domain-containing protein n=1 Tax=Oscillibacter hominis TaxID=2763056 RepID=A0A7G9B730_9FIRM|nr:S-layer homology domain-containing protein [Oscillibacter hominis]QNL45361.1 S-layer homology domain-containing protein [Oscillibacter hominis]
MRKKMLSIFLALCLALSLLPTAVFAEEPEAPAEPEEVMEPVEETQEPESVLAEAGAAYQSGQDQPTEAANEAKIGDKEFATLKEAVAAAEDGNTIILLADVTATTSDNSVAIDKAVTLELAGHSLIAKEYGWYSLKAEITVKNGTVSYEKSDGLSISAPVTITDCTLTGSTGSAVKLSSGGSLTANNCTFEMTGNGSAAINGTADQVRLNNCTVKGGTSTYAINLDSNDVLLKDCTMSGGTFETIYAAVSNAGGTFTVNGGSITANAGKPAASITWNSKGTLVMTGGVTVAGSVKMYGNPDNAGGHIRLEGGYYNSDTTLVSNKPANVEVTGGFYTANSNVTDFVRAPYMVVANTDTATKETYPKAIAAPAEGAVAYAADVEGGTSYMDIDVAIAQADGKPILLLANVTLGSLPANTVINAQNKSVTYNGSLAQLVSTGAELSNVGTLTVNDGTIGGFTMEGKQITAGFVPEALRAVVVKYIPDNYSIGDQSSSSGKVAATSSFGATIGRTGYETLGNALSVACRNDTSSGQVNDVVVMQKDEASYFEALSYATYTLDLNGHKLGSPDPNPNSSEPSYGFGIIPVKQSALSPNYANITLTDSATGGEIIGYDFGVVLNGEVLGAKLVLDGVKVTSTAGEGVYFPGQENSSLTIKSGTEITGSTGLGIKGGNVIIEDGAKITGTRETSEVPDAAVSSGISDLTGDAVYVECGYNFPLSLTIQGGCFSSKAGQMVRMLFAEKTEVEETVSITGGYFSAKPDSTYLAKNYYVQPSDQEGYSYMVSNSAVAQIGANKYGTLAEAVAAAEDNATIKLLKDTDSGDMLKVGKSMTLDLGGHTFTSTNSSYAVAVIGGTFTVKNGTISNTSKDGVALYAQQATVVVENGANILSNATAIQVGNCIKDKAGVYWGEAIVRQGAHVKGDAGVLVAGPYPVESLQPGGTLSAEMSSRSKLTVTGGTIEGVSYGITGNGTYHGTEITVSGGTVRQSGADGGALYHPQNGVLNISGNAVLEGASGVQLCSGEGVIANITGGSISATGEDLRAGKTGDGFIPDGAALSVVNRSYPGGAPKMTVSGGYFSAKNNASVLAYTWSGNAASPWEQANEYLTLSGGRFTSDPTAYLAAEYLAVTEDYTTGGITYRYAVQEKKNDVAVVVAPPDVKTPENASDDLIAVAEEMAEASKSTPAPKGLDTAANKVAQNTNLTSSDTSVKNALEKANIDTANKTVTIVVQPYLAVEVVDCVQEGAEAKLELNITPMYNTVATTAENPTTASSIVIGTNAAVVGSAKTMTVTTPVTITIPLPDGFATENLKVQHTKSNGSVYYYQAVVEGETSKTAAFTVTHGFSKFVLKADNRTATVTFKNGETIVAENQSFTSLNVGDTLPTATKSGYSFSGWTFEGISGTYKTLTDDLLDALDGKTVTATAKFSSNSGGGGGGGGGSSVVTPPTGWKNPFTDVDENDWCYDAVKYAVEKGLFNGTTDTTFSPDATMTRGMLVTVLYRLEGSPAVAASASFSDVAADSYCAKAVAWASANSIVNGFTEDTFAPNSNITREQMAAILYRYAQYKGMNAVTLEENLTAFPDADDISAYAVSAMNWAVGKQLITGKADGTLAPKGNATRAQVATILMRYCETVAK